MYNHQELGRGAVEFFRTTLHCLELSEVFDVVLQKNNNFEFCAN